MIKWVLRTNECIMLTIIKCKFYDAVDVSDKLTDVKRWAVLRSGGVRNIRDEITDFRTSLLYKV